MSGRVFVCLGYRICLYLLIYYWILFRQCDSFCFLFYYFYYVHFNVIIYSMFQLSRPINYLPCCVKLKCIWKMNLVIFTFTNDVSFIWVILHVGILFMCLHMSAIVCVSIYLIWSNCFFYMVIYCFGIIFKNVSYQTRYADIRLGMLISD